jgi:hypothetical protein
MSALEKNEAEFFLTPKRPFSYVSAASSGKCRMLEKFHYISFEEIILSGNIIAAAS